MWPPPNVQPRPASRPASPSAAVQPQTQAPRSPASSRLTNVNANATDAAHTLTRAPQGSPAREAPATGRRAASFQAVDQTSVPQSHAAASVPARSPVAAEAVQVAHRSDHRNFRRIGGAAAASGNNTATFEDRAGNQWIGKQTSGLAGTVSEVVAQRLATAVLGAHRAPETLLANDGTVFSQKPAGRSDNLETFFSDSESLEALDPTAKQSIQNTFLDALVFKIITGDPDIVADNFVIDINRHTVIPIDGEHAFPGTSARADSYGLWSREAFNNFVKKPAEQIDDMFNGDAGFLSKGIDSQALLHKFSEQTDKIYNDNYALVTNATAAIISDLAELDAHMGALTRDPELTSELSSKIDKILPMMQSHVEQIYAYVQEMDRP